MNTADPFDQLQTNWPLPNWLEIFTAIRSQLWLLLLINVIYSGGALFLRRTGHPFLLLIPQILVGYFLTLAYYRAIINPEDTVWGIFSKVATLLPFAIWILWLKSMANCAGFFLLVVPGIYVSARLILVEALVAADRPGISDHPLKASWKLTESHVGAMCAIIVSLVVYMGLILVASRWIGTALQPSAIFFRAFLGLPLSLGWMGYKAICTVHAMEVQPEEFLTPLPTPSMSPGWDGWLMRFFTGLGIFVVFMILMMGVGYFLGLTPFGSKVTRALSRLNSSGGNVIIHEKTVLVPPAPWIASPEPGFPGSQAVSFRLTAIGGMRNAPQIRLAWLPIGAPSVMDQETAQRLSGLVIRGMDALELQPTKVFRKLYDLQMSELAKYHIDGLSIVQNPDPPGWIVMRSRGNPPGATFRRDRFMPWDGGLLVLEDTRYSFQDGTQAEMQERPLISALKLP